MIIKVLCLTKNEYDVIERFIQYYGFLVGFDNVHIIDNGSTNPLVLDVYDKYRKLGLHVLTDVFPWSQKEVCARMTAHARSLECDWLLPVDTDEFVVWDNLVTTLITTKFDLLHFLVFESAVDVLHSNYKDGAFIDPVLNITNFKPVNVSKFIVRKKAFINFTLYLHSAQINGIATNTALPLLHFCNTGSRRIFEKSREMINNGGSFLRIDFNKSDGELYEELLPHENTPIISGHKVNILIDHYRRKVLNDVLYVEKPLENVLFCDSIKTFLTEKLGLPRK
jgi:hypothetical protein